MKKVFSNISFLLCHTWMLWLAFMPPLKAQTLPDSLFQKLEYANTPEELLAANTAIGKAYISISPDSARKYLFEGLTYANVLYDTLQLADIKRMLGNSYWMEGIYDISLKYYFEALESYESIEYELGKSYALNNIGEVYKKQGDLSSSLKFLMASINALPHNSDIKPLMGYNNVGELYLRLEELDSAEKYFSSILDHANKETDKRVIAYAHAGLGKLAIKLGNRASALAAFNKSLQLRKEIKDARNIQMSYHDIADAYMAMARYPMANIYLDSASEVLNTIKASDIEIEFHLKKFKVDSALGNFPSAIQHLQKHYKLRDAVFNIEKSFLTQELDTKYLSEKNRREYETLKLQSDLREAQLAEIRFTIAFIAVALFSLILIIFLLARSKTISSKQREELRDKALSLEDALAELKATAEDNQSFSYSVSHDLKAPLRIISFYTATLQEEIEEAGHHGLLPTVHRIKANISKMEIIIRDILELSVVSQSDVKYQKVDLSRIAKEYLAECYNNEPNRKITTDIQSNIEVFADAGLMRVLMKNVLENAWKYSSLNENAALSMYQDDKGTIVIKDNGTGFDMKYYDQIFQPFKRLHSENEFEGTGIGLSIVNRIIKKHGGKIWAESKIGIGTSIYFIIPARNKK